MEQDKTVKIENWQDIRELVLMSIGTDKGSWWADPDFGSELYVLKQNGKVDGKTAGNLQRMLTECLTWLLEDKIVRDINCRTERSEKNTITYVIEIIKNNSDKIYIKDIYNAV